MSTIDKYGIQYGTGELFPQDNPGGVTDPNAVTKRRAKGNNGSFVQGGSTAVPEDPTAGLGQDLLNAIQMGNLGTGHGVYGRRESNTFYFKSITAGAGISISSTSDTIVITNTGGGGSGPGTVIVADTSSIDLAGDGSSVPLTAIVKLSADTDNAIEVRADGLYAAVGAEGPQGPAGADGAQGPIGPQGPAGPAGADGQDGADGTSLNFKGAADDIADLPASGNTEGDAWIVDSNVWIWTNGAWVDGGPISGPQGPIGPQGPQGEDGPAGIRVLGTLPDEQSLPTVDNVPGDAYFVQNHLWVFVEIANDWVDMGDFSGPIGPQGPIGVTGAAGAQGDPGVAGADGADGDDGISITGASVNASGHLILTLSDTSTLDAGEVGINNLVDLLDVNIAPTGADNGKAVIWNSTSNKFVLGTAGGGGSSDFLALTDSPDSYAGEVGRLVAVAPNEAGLIFVDPVDTFLELKDTPASYQSENGKFVRVNAAGTGLEFAAAAGGATTFLALSDTPSTFTGAAGRFLRVNAGTSAIEFVAAPTFLDLPDVTPSTFVGQAGKIVAVNSAENGVEFIAPPTSGGGNGSAVMFTIVLDSSNVVTSVTNLPAGWSTVSMGNGTFTIQMDVSVHPKSVVFHGQSGPTTYVSRTPTATAGIINYDTATPNQFTISALTATFIGSASLRTAKVAIIL